MDGLELPFELFGGLEVFLRIIRVFMDFFESTSGCLLEQLLFTEEPLVVDYIGIQASGGDHRSDGNAYGSEFFPAATYYESKEHSTGS